MAGKVSSSSLTRLLVLFLCLSHLLISSLAVPATRSLKPGSESAIDQSLPLTQEGGGDMFEVGEGRMDMEESTDYPGTGANNHHDPKSPGTFGLYD